MWRPGTPRSLRQESCEGDTRPAAIARRHGTKSSQGGGLELQSGYALPPFQATASRLTLIDAQSHLDCRAAPACPSRGSGWCVHTTDRASRVAPVPLFHACRRHYPGGTGRRSCRSLPGRWQPSPIARRVGFRISRFEACSAFTRVAARMVARGRPRRPFHRSASGHVVTSITRSDCYRLERQLPGGICTR